MPLRLIATNPTKGLAKSSERSDYESSGIAMRIEKFTFQFSRTTPNGQHINVSSDGCHRQPIRK